MALEKVLYYQSYYDSLFTILIEVLVKVEVSDVFVLSEILELLPHAVHYPTLTPVIVRITYYLDETTIAKPNQHYNRDGCD